MPYHEAFDIDSAQNLMEIAGRLGLELPYREDISPLLEPIRLGAHKLPNRLVVLPMEGADGYTTGTPSDRTARRYRRYAEGGSGMIWFEAAAVQPEARSNSRQLMINGENLDTYRSLLDGLRKSARRRFGESHEIFCVLQLTHAGRYRRVDGRPHPLVITFNPYLDQAEQNLTCLTDTDLDRLKETYLNAARLAFHAGFDAVDLKACHGYLLNELLAAYSRENSRYGKSFENRTRFLTELTHLIHADLPKLILTARLSAFDGIPYPFGFGFSKDSPLAIDLTELKALIRRLLLLGGSLFSISVGNPHDKPHMGRPYDRPLPDSSLPDEHPLEGVRRLLNVTGALQEHFPNVPFVGAGYSWLRRFFPNVAAAEVAEGRVSMIGLGRSSFAYPEAPRDLMDQGKLDPQKLCICCSRCSELLRSGLNTGCVVRDGGIYAEEYKKLQV